MSGQYQLFFDRREKVDPMADWRRARQSVELDDPAEVIESVKAIDFEYPVLLVYRPEGEDRWSYITLNRSDSCDDTLPDWRGEAFY